MKQYQGLLVVVVILLVAIAGYVIYRTVAVPPETIGNYKSIPPKGAGKGDPEGWGG